MMLTDADEGEADLVRQHPFVDDVAEDVGVVQGKRPSAPVVTSPKVSSPSSIGARSAGRVHRPQVLGA